MLNCFQWAESLNASQGAKKKKRSGQCSTYVRPDRVRKQQRVRAVTGRETSPPSRAQMSCSLWPSHTEGGRAEFGVTLMCHLDLDAGSVSAKPTWPDICALERTCVRDLRLAFSQAGKKNMWLPSSVIPQEQASLEGMVQQKLGHCGC